jgi:hypothetical protein
MSEVLLLCYNARAHTSVHTTVVITNLDEVLLHPTYSCKLVPSDYLSGPLKGSLQRKNSNIFYWLDIHALVQRWKKTWWMWRLWKNINAWSNVVVNFCEMFTCLVYTQHEIKRTESNIFWHTHNTCCPTPQCSSVNVATQYMNYDHHT